MKNLFKALNSKEWTCHESQNGSTWKEWDLGCGQVTKREESSKVQVGVHIKVQGEWFSWEIQS